MSLSDAFHAGGWPMYPTLISGILLILAAARYAARPDGRQRPLLVSLGLVTLLWGTAGFVLGLIRTLSFIGEVRPDQRYIVLIGLGESLNDVALALLLCLAASMVAAVGALRRSLSEDGVGADRLPLS